MLESYGDTHRESIWLLTRDKSRLSRSFRVLVGGIFGDHAVEYMEFIRGADQETYLAGLRGMKLSVEIKPGPGYTIHSDGEGYIGKDAILGTAVTQSHPDIYKVKREAEAKNLKRSYNKLVNSEATYATDNYEALQNIEKTVASSTRPKGFI